MKNTTTTSATSSEFESLHFASQEDTKELAYYFDSFKDYAKAAGWSDWMNEYASDPENARGDEPTDAEQLEIDRVLRGYWDEAQTGFTVWLISLHNGKYDEQRGKLGKFQTFEEAARYYDAMIKITQRNHESGTEGYEIHQGTEAIAESYDNSQSIFRDPSKKEED